MPPCECYLVTEVHGAGGSGTDANAGTVRREDLRMIAAVRRSLSSENPTELGLGERRANGVAVDPEIVRLGIGSDGNIVTADALTKGTVRHGCTGPAHDATAKQSTNGDRRRASSAAWSGCCAGRCSHRSARRAIVANSDSTSPVTGSWL